jgi:hypothetical protein
VKTKVTSTLRLIIASAAILTTANLLAQSTTTANQTEGFGDNKVLTFTYLQQFDCVDQPHDDLNFNGIPADRDPAEFQTPICQADTKPNH